MSTTTEMRVKEAMETHGFDVTIENKHIRFSTSKSYVTAYQFVIMQMAGEVECINFPTNTIYMKRSKQPINQTNLSKINQQEIFPYLPVKFNRLSFEFRCLQCRGVLIQKMEEPDQGSFCSNCMEALQCLSDQYEKAPTRLSFDPEEVKEYEKGDKPNADDKGVSVNFGPQ